MSKTLEEFLIKIPEEYRNSLILLEKFKGNRTMCKFVFSCGCETSQVLKAILKLKDFQYCYFCKNKFCQKFICKYCRKEFVQLKMYEQCLFNCSKKYFNLIENIDFVICQICGFHSKSLGYHFNKSHNLTSKEYKKQFPNAKIISHNSSGNYSVSAIKNGNWFNKAKERGDDLTEYFEKVSCGVKKFISENPKEIVRRAEVMTKVNKSDIMRKKSSETAKITSARIDIQLARSEKLKKWRDENPIDFYEKCVKPMIDSWQSKPEKKLFEYVSLLEGFSFKRNQRLKSNTFLSITKEKQIDIADKNKRIYIEFDGIHHFKDVFGKLSLNKEKDRLLDDYINKNNWTLIRVSLDQFKYSTKNIDKVKQDASYFKQECLDKILEILNNKVPGIYKIGEAYGKY